MSACTGRTRLLYLTAAFPYPLSSGYLRHFHLLRELACNHYIHLMALTGPTFEPVHTAGIDPFVDRISTFTRPPTTRAARLHRLLDPAHPNAAVDALVRAVDDEVRSGRVDVAILSGKETAAAAPTLSGRVPLIVDLCDATSHRITQQIDLAGPVRRAGLTVRRRGMRRIEHQLVDLGDSLLTASARDRVELRDEGAPDRVLDARVIPNGIDLRHWHRTSETLGDAVVFCGNLAYSANADAARQLVTTVMPLVWEERPETRAILIGRGASSELEHDLAQPRVRFTGEVPDVRPFLERGAVFAAPLRVATGIQNKLLEALAMELPVVTTSVAAAGLRSGAGLPPMVVSDEPAEQAAAIVASLPQPGSSARPYRTGRDWVAARFSWERSGTDLSTLVDSLHHKEQAAC